MVLRRNPGKAIALVLAAHPLFATLVALGVGAAAALSGRSGREVGLVVHVDDLPRVRLGAQHRIQLGFHHVTEVATRTRQELQTDHSGVTGSGPARAARRT